MKKVEFVRVKSEYNSFGMFKGQKYEFNDVEDIIKTKIQEGWEFCGYVPIITTGTGEIETMSLVFQKDVE